MPVPLKHISLGSEKGAALIIVVALLALAGSIILLGVGVFKIEDPYDRVLETSQRQEFVIDQLAAYVQRELRLPCPADPTVDPSTRDFGFEPTAGCDNTTAEGILPFRTLFLSEDDARDGWGNFMTYRISPVLANLTGNTVFMRCRRFPWFDSSFSGENVFPEKARFCCPPIDSPYDGTNDLQIYDSIASRDAGTTIDGIGRLATAADYDDINTGTATTYPTLPATGNEVIFAFALISHGSNTGGPAGDAEDENLDGDNIIISMPISMSRDVNPFDDIVTWRTQISLMGELNNASCYLPWR